MHIDHAKVFSLKSCPDTLIITQLLDHRQNHKESWSGRAKEEDFFCYFSCKIQFCVAHYIKYICHGDSYTANETRAASVMMCISLCRSGVMACVLAITALRAPFYSAPALSNVFVRGRHSYTDF
jgi:hypothetical protein